MIKNIQRGVVLECLLENKKFISLAFQSDDQEWLSCLEGYNVQDKDVLNEARDIAQMLGKPQYEGPIPEERKKELWASIVAHSKRRDRRLPQIIISHSRELAAVLFMVLLVGTVFFLQRNSSKENFLISSSLSELKNPVLILSAGEMVELDSSLQQMEVIEGENSILIAGDSVVKYDASSGTNGYPIKMNEIVVPYGRMTTVNLSDGTVVWLNAGSQLKFPVSFSEDSRTVFLSGEGYFEVAKNQEKPFIVETPDIRIQVLGTHFDVSAYANDPVTQTVLLEGRVSIKPQKGLFRREKIMEKGQKATFQTSNNEIVIEKTDNLSRYISWKEGWYEFFNEDLSVVLKKLERFYNVDFVYDRSLMERTFPVSGKLDVNHSLEAVLKVLSPVAKMNYTIADNQIFLEAYP